MTDPMTVPDFAVQDRALQDLAVQGPAVQDAVDVPAPGARLDGGPAAGEGADEGSDDTADDAVAVAEARVSTVLDGLAALADASPDEQVEAFAAAQRTLRATLSDIDNG